MESPKATITDDDEDGLLVLIVGDQNYKTTKNRQRKSDRIRKRRAMKTTSSSAGDMKVSVEIEKLEDLVNDKDEDSAKVNNEDSNINKTNFPNINDEYSVRDKDSVKEEDLLRVEDDDLDIDKNHIPNISEESHDEDADETTEPTPSKRRMRLLPPALQKSYVREMCAQEPKMESDKELLIDTLSSIMAITKCPTPPLGYYRMIENTYECRECEVKRDTKLALARHWQDKHGPRYLICYACGADFRSATNLYKHEKRCNSPDAIVVLKARARIKKYKGTTPGRPFHLPDSFFKKESYLFKLKETNPIETQDRNFLIKKLCKRMAEDSANQPKPPADFYDTNEKMFVCRTCDAEDKTLNGLARHWQYAHGPRYLVCYACGLDFRDIRNLYKHEKRCGEPLVDVVLEARNISLGNRARNRPELKLPPPKETVALTLRNELGNRAPNRPELELPPPKETVGLTLSPETGMYTCGECQAEFKTLPTAKAHSLAHGRRYRCMECPATYTNNAERWRHFEEAHTTKTYLCDKCFCTFGCKSTLRCHMKTHLPKRKHACPQCDKQYAQGYALRIHIDRDHKGLPPPFACQMCPKRYPKMSLLKKHMLDKHGMKLITQRMLSKTLPSLSEKQLETAHIVKKSGSMVSIQAKNINVQSDEPANANESLEDNEDIECHEINDDDDDVMVENNDFTENIDEVQQERKIEQQGSLEKNLKDEKLTEITKTHESSTDNTKLVFFTKKYQADKKNKKMYKLKQLLDSPQSAQQDEIITANNRVVTVKNNVINVPQTPQSPQVKVKTKSRKRKQYYRKKTM